MTRITISMREQEKAALRVLSEIEFRDPRQQAALIIRQELERRGLLVIPQADPTSSAHIVTAQPIPHKRNKRKETLSAMPA